MNTFLFIAGWLIFAFWLNAFRHCFHGKNWYLRERIKNIPPLQPWPQVSVIVPACNEDADIEENLRSLLKSDYPNLEIIAINDRSTDTTGRIMDHLAQSDQRLRVLHLDTLPEGWLGKNHAMHQGAEMAKGEYLLFTDGDIFFQPETLTLAIQYAQHKNLDHLCLFPDFIRGGFWENLLICHFGIIFFINTKPARVPTDDKSAYIGIGAFNLVRHTVYQQVEGHQKLRMEVIDDMKLGKLIKNSGFKQEGIFAGDLVRVRWHVGMHGVVRGLEKNGFAACGYSWPYLISITTISMICALGPYLAIFTLSSPAIWGYVITLLLIHTVYALKGHEYSRSWYITFAFPIAALVLTLAFWRSAIITHRQGGIRWRDTFYSLDQLKRHKY